MESVYQILEQLRESMLEQNVSKWLNLFALEDDIALEALTNWFNSYCVINKLSRCFYQYLPSDNPMTVKCKWVMCYEEYEPVIEKINYTICINNGIPRVKKFQKDISVEGVECCGLGNLHNCTNTKKSTNWVRFSNNNNPDTIERYSRAIARTIRFRKSNINLECASVLACMMSNVTYSIAQQINKNINEFRLQYIYNSLVNVFEISLLREDRSNLWQSKFTVPWYGIEEAINMSYGNERIIVNCHMFMVLLYSVLRMCGWTSSELLIFRSGNHDNVLVKQDEKLYLIHNSGMHLVNSRKIIPLLLNEVTVYDETWVSIKDEYIKDSTLKNADILKNLFEYRRREKKCDIPEYQWMDNSENSFLDFVSQYSKKNPESIYTWALYAFQSLEVSKPQTYVYWSIKNNTVKDLIKRVNEDVDLLELIRGFSKKSIFMEEQRIMTADQVLRCHTGDSKALAILYYSVMKRKYNGEGGVILNSSSSYCGFYRNNHWEIIDFNTLKKTYGIVGQIFLILNDESSFFPLRNGVEIYPKWFLKLIKEDKFIHEEYDTKGN